MSKQEKTKFIIYSLIMGINCELYKDNTDKDTIDLAFYKILKHIAKNIMHCAKWWLYYCCLVHSMIYTCKDLNLLDDVYLFISSHSGYVVLNAFNTSGQQI